MITYLAAEGLMKKLREELYPHKTFVKLGN